MRVAEWMTKLFLALLVLGVPARARAQGWPHSEFRAETPQNGVRRHVRRHRVHHKRREVRRVVVIRSEPRKNLDGCKPMEHGTGMETRVSDPVKRAEQAWSAAVAYKWGEVYADLRNARRASVRCSDPRPDTVVDRTAGAVGLDTSRRICRIEAVPCMAPAQEWRPK